MTANIPVESRGPLGRFGVELLLFLGLAIAAAVFVLRPTARVARPAVVDSTSVHAPGSAASAGAATSRASKVEIKSLGRSPTRPIFGSLPFTDAERTTQLNICMGRAKSASTYPEDGVGVAELAHTGTVGEALVFDGPAHNLTTGRQLVWRCKISNWDGRVGGMDFATLEGIGGVPLEWNAIAELDEEVLRRCVVGAQALYPGGEVPTPSNIGRRADSFQLIGDAKAQDGVWSKWACNVRLQQGAIASLDVAPGGSPQ